LSQKSILNSFHSVVNFSNILRAAFALISFCQKITNPNFLKKIYFFGLPHLATCIFLFFYNEPELGVGIDPGMALTPVPSSIGLDGNQTQDLPIVS